MKKPPRQPKAPTTMADALVRIARLERQVRRLERELESTAKRADEAARESEERHRALAGAREQQSSTSEILRVMASTQREVQPVFEAIARNAVTLCEGYFCAVLTLEGEMIRLRATHNMPAEGLRALEQTYPVPVGGPALLAAALRERRIIHVLDMQNEEGGSPGARERARLIGHRSWVAVPMVHEGRGVGVIAVSRREIRRFTDENLALLETFADQAVIAIENVRLFKELEARNRDLTEALEQQTATSEVLRVISSSPTDLRPVFDAMARSAARLCEARDARVHVLEGDVLRMMAALGPAPMSGAVGELTIPVLHGSVNGRAIMERRVVHVADLQSEAEEFPIAFGRPEGLRTSLAVPLLREGDAIGTIFIFRTEVRPFSDKQIALLQTFADQAVIAIENVRLFHEIQAAQCRAARGPGAPDRDRGRAADHCRVANRAAAGARCHRR